MLMVSPQAQISNECQVWLGCLSCLLRLDLRAQIFPTSFTFISSSQLKFIRPVPPHSLSVRLYWGRESLSAAYTDCLLNPASLGYCCYVCPCSCSADMQFTMITLSGLLQILSNFWKNGLLISDRGRQSRLLVSSRRLLILLIEMTTVTGRFRYMLIKLAELVENAVTAWPF